MKFNIIQAWGIEDFRVRFRMLRTKYYKEGDILTDLDENTYLVEDVQTTGLVLRRLNWWGELLHYFGWLV